MDPDSLIIHIKSEDIYKNIANDVEERFDTSNYDVNRYLPVGKNKKVFGLMKDELGGTIMVGVIAMRPKTYSYLMDDGNSDKIAKWTMSKQWITKSSMPI